MQIHADVFDCKAKLQSHQVKGRKSGSSSFPEIHYADDKGDAIIFVKNRFK